MKNVLITGAIGQVGFESIQALIALKSDINIIAGVRDVNKDADKFKNLAVHVVSFDFEQPDGFEAVFQNIDILFLLRPPQIADVKKYFKPIISAVQKSKIAHIVFLSVQGADQNSIIPHHKIERLIVSSGINYTFVRPAYFMQNFTTTLSEDIIKRKEIYLPAGKAQFTIIDLKDLGLVVAHVLSKHQNYINQAFDVTNHELKTFGEMAREISIVVGFSIQYKSPNLISFYFRKRKEGMAPAFIFVMIMLHFFPRFQKPPLISNPVFQITGKKSNSFLDFASREKGNWMDTKKATNFH